MQAIWRGAINFGMVSIPVRLHSATEEKTLRFNLLHKEDEGRIRNNRTCTVCGKTDLGRDELARAYEYEKGSYVKFEDDELKNVEIDTSHTVRVEYFTPSEQIDPIFYQRSYYLAPDELGVKPYALLRKMLIDANRVAVAKVAIRDKERLGVLRVRGDVLVLETMYWPDEIREARFPEISADVELSEGDLKSAQMLVEAQTEDFDPSRFHDRYRDALLAAVERKIEGQEIVAPTASEEAPQVIDLTEALKRSLEQVQQRSKASGE
jgi:DNA end-binding protein Ku